MDNISKGLYRHLVADLEKLEEEYVKLTEDTLKYKKIYDECTDINDSREHYMNYYNSYRAMRQNELDRKSFLRIIEHLYGND